MKFFKCPCCNKLHFTRLNGLSFENPYKTLKEHTIKKRLKCGKCHNNLAIFINNKTSEIKIIWEEYYKIYDDAYQKQKDLQQEKEQVLKIEDEKEKQKQLEQVLKKIRKIQNDVAVSQSKLRIKARVISPEASAGMTERLS
jgi:transcription elongation factor Elf1|tara:strand:+ start:59 stop:481 length:423 start_codon:yes stop_codon:yes gene_type:complete